VLLGTLAHGERCNPRVWQRQGSFVKARGTHLATYAHMNVATKLGLLFCSTILAFGCAENTEDDIEEADYALGKSGNFTFLTYNVHGMPNVVTSRNPKADMPQISPKLNSYDAVVVQKDFVYHDELISRLTLPNRTTARGTWFDLGDGLNAFSKFRITDVVREQWKNCNGYLGNRSDCWAPKGVMKFTMELAPGVLVDVYDIHMDAGRSAKDIETRNKQVAQLKAKIAATSPNRAIIVSGDTSMRESDEPTLQALLTGSNLKDACRALPCPEPTRVNRVMFRDSATLKFTVKEWKAETTFVNGTGQQLSDQEPVKVTFSWRAN
jgi:hypothetical protein